MCVFASECNVQQQRVEMGGSFVCILHDLRPTRGNDPLVARVHAAAQAQAQAQVPSVEIGLTFSRPSRPVWNEAKMNLNVAGWMSDGRAQI